MNYSSKNKASAEAVIPEIKHYPLNKIKYFKMTGEINYSQNISGGGGSGGGVNTAGAMYGGLLFGSVGAIVGSQLGTETHINEIKTEINRHDDRVVEFIYENAHGVAQSITFDPSVYDCLMKLIPEKAFDFVMTQNRTKQEQKSTEPENKSFQGGSSFSQLKELKEHLDMDIITQEEFDAKKAQILGL